MQKCRKASRVKAIAQTKNAAARADTVLGAGSLKQPIFMWARHKTQLILSD
jgi:hypothetical protein